MILYSRNAIHSSRSREGSREKWRIAIQRDSLFPKMQHPAVKSSSSKLRPSHHGLSVSPVAITTRIPSTTLRSHAPISQISLSGKIEFAHFGPAGVVHKGTVPPRGTSRRRSHWAHDIVAFVYFRFWLCQSLSLCGVFVVI